mmetsp:Transcript_37332/g.41255  ORF Transcript_37332/g.41255 Transcript_37332/m.41255 type:complete len:151 (+) Transcript_37332:155-607(+)
MSPVKRRRRTRTNTSSVGALLLPPLNRNVPNRIQQQQQDGDDDNDNDDETTPTDSIDSSPKKSFYQENIAPLHLFLDENSPEEAQQKVIDFFIVCATEWRLCDVVTLLRSIRNNRTDDWKRVGYPNILESVDQKIFDITGCNLDRSFLMI